MRPICWAGAQNSGLGISGQSALPAHNQVLKTRSKYGQPCGQVAGPARKTADWGSADEAQKTRSLARTEAHFWLDLVRAFRGAPEALPADNLALKTRSK
jgi:hypothetical protein